MDDVVSLVTNRAGQTFRFGAELFGLEMSGPVSARFRLGDTSSPAVVSTDRAARGVVDVAFFLVR